MGEEEPTPEIALWFQLEPLYSMRFNELPEHERHQQVGVLSHEHSNEVRSLKFSISNCEFGLYRTLHVPYVLLLCSFPAKKFLIIYPIIKKKTETNMIFHFSPQKDRDPSLRILTFRYICFCLTN